MDSIKMSSAFSNKELKKHVHEHIKNWEPKEVFKCVTCGSLVTVEGNVTKYYVPVIGDILREIKALYEVDQHRVPIYIDTLLKELGQL